MIYLISPAGEVFAYETQAAREQYGAPDLRPMTAAEVAAHLAPVPPDQRIPILVRLTEIDAASARPLRAILVGSATDDDRARLVELDEQAAALRAELAALEPPPAA